MTGSAPAGFGVFGTLAFVVFLLRCHEGLQHNTSRRIVSLQLFVGIPFVWLVTFWFLPQDSVVVLPASNYFILNESTNKIVPVSNTSYGNWSGKKFHVPIEYGYDYVVSLPPSIPKQRPTKARTINGYEVGYDPPQRPWKDAFWFLIPAFLTHRLLHIAAINLVDISAYFVPLLASLCTGILFLICTWRYFPDQVGTNVFWIEIVACVAIAYLLYVLGPGIKNLNLISRLNAFFGPATQIMVIVALSSVILYAVPESTSLIGLIVIGAFSLVYNLFVSRTSYWEFPSRHERILEFVIRTLTLTTVCLAFWFVVEIFINPATPELQPMPPAQFYDQIDSGIRFTGAR